jgi:16S rRNA (cytosine1402-N4)-methyltransferase
MYHQPVLKYEVIQNLITSTSGLYLDCTMGGANHSKAILDSLGKNGALVGLDWDEDAQYEALHKLGHDKRFSCYRMNFAEMLNLPGDVITEGFNGILMDLGVSSHFFDSAERGFSYMHDGPLDMRMDQRRQKTAADVLRDEDVEELGRIFREYGDIRSWWKLAELIVNTRDENPFERTSQLTEIVEKNFGTNNSYKMLSQVFQSLRVVVNDELENLERGLDSALELLKVGGVLAVISFQSQEDKFIKHRFRSWAEQEQTNRNLPALVEHDPLVKLIKRKGITPSADEITANPRARSSRLRLAVKLRNRNDG